MGSHGHLLQYWRRLQEALEAPLIGVYIVGLKLNEGLWPHSRFEVDEHLFLHNGKLREEHQPDDQYVGSSNLHPAPAFRVADNVHEGHLLIQRSQEQDIVRPIWVCCALSPPNLAVTRAYPRQILVQWFTPTSTARDLSKKWNGWDSNPNFKWKLDLKYSINDLQPIDCILAAWPLPEHQDVEPLKVTISPYQIGFAKDNLCCCAAQEHGWRVVEADVPNSSGHAIGRRPMHGQPFR